LDIGFSLLVGQQAAWKGRKSAQNSPSRKDGFFRLTWVLFSEKFGVATHPFISPVSTGITARHWRALLFLGFGISSKGEAKCGTAPHKRGV
jgi:hypothetical protein